MRDVPMPRDLTEEAVAEWAFLAAMGPESSETWATTDERTKEDVYRLARAVLALVSSKVREGVAGGYAEGYRDHRDRDFTFDSDEQRHIDETVARVMGREVKRG
jgi:hypothetical protein